MAEKAHFGVLTGHSLCHVLVYVSLVQSLLIGIGAVGAGDEHVVHPCLFHLQMNGSPVSSGMGTCGLVGQIGVYAGWVADVAAGTKAGITALDWIGLILISFILPAILTPLFAVPFRKAGLIKDGDMKLD